MIGKRSDIHGNRALGTRGSMNNDNYTYIMDDCNIIYIVCIIPGSILTIIINNDNCSYRQLRIDLRVSWARNWNEGHEECLNGFHNVVIGYENIHNVLPAVDG